MGPPPGARQNHLWAAGAGNLRRDLDQSRTLAYLQAETFDRGPFSRAKANVSIQRHYEQQTRVRGNGGQTRTGFEIYTLGAVAEAESDLPTPLPVTLTYGLDYYHDFVDTFENDRGFLPDLVEDFRLEPAGVVVTHDDRVERLDHPDPVASGVS